MTSPRHAHPPDRGARAEARRDRVILTPHTSRRSRQIVWLTALVVVLGSVLAVTAWASPSQPATQHSAARPAPQQPPLPVPPVGTCPPNSPEPACQLPTSPQRPSIPATPLPPITELPPPTSCFPGQVGCTPSSPPASSPAPCTGEDCIPQPTTAPPGPGTGPTDPGTGADESDCGITNISGCINEAINAVFRDLVKSAMDPILKLLGDTAFTTPTLDELPGVANLWNNSWLIVLACYAGLVLIGGIIVMAHESVQNRYSLKEIAPRMVTSFIASSLSLFVIDKVIRLANALAAAMLGDGVDPPKLGDNLAQSINGIYSAQVSGGLFLILLHFALMIAVIALLLVWVIRVIITLILIVSAPLWVACHALPHTDGIARWCERALGATLAIQVAQSLTLIVALNTFLNGSVHLFSSVGGGLMMLFAALGLLYVLFKIPFWLLSATKLGGGGKRSFLGGLIKAVIVAKTFGALSGASSGIAKAGARGGAVKAGRGVARPRGGGAADPPWPPQRPSSTPEAVNKRMQESYDAERARAARQSRLPSQEPQFLQPGAQHSTHDPAITPANPGRPTMPDFSSAPSPATPPPPPTGRRRRVPTPLFQAPASPRRGQAPARPIRVAAVPPQLRFQAPVTEPAPPVASPTRAPAAPTFRPAQPEPRVGDARPRTQSVPPLVFRAPPVSKSVPRGGEQK